MHFCQRFALILIALAMTCPVRSASVEETFDFETTETWRTEADFFTDNPTFVEADLRCTGIVLLNELAGGLEFTTDHAQTGTYSGRWADHPRFPSLMAITVPANWSTYTHIRFQAWSDVRTDEIVFLAVRSDNAVTPARDFYLVAFRVDWEGPRTFTIPLAAFQPYRSPAGWDQVDSLSFLTKLFMHEPHPATVLYLDTVELISAAPSPSDFAGVSFDRLEPGQPGTLQEATPPFNPALLNHPFPETRNDQTVTTPIQYEPYFKAERALFNYFPRFAPAAVSIDPRGRHYIRYDQVVQVRGPGGRWIARDARPFIDAYVENTYDWINYTTRGGGFYDEPIIRFDRDGDAYMHVILQEIKANGDPYSSTERPGTRGYHGLLLHSGDECRTWGVYPLTVPFARFEKLDGHNTGCLDRPPVVLLHSHFSSGQTAGYILMPEKKPDGTLDLSNVTEVYEDLLRFNYHSGDGNSCVTSGGKVFIAFSMTVDGVVDHPIPIPPNHPALGMTWEASSTTYDLKDGTAAYIVEYDIATGQVSEPVFLGFGGHAVDDHNWPGITIDSQGYLHVIINGHHDPVYYVRSSNPRDITAWETPELVGLGHSYSSLNCDAADTLYIVSRCSRLGYRFMLAMLRKPSGQPWEAESYLVKPFKPYYKNWRHKVTLDTRTGRLFLAYAAQSNLINTFKDEYDAYLFRWPDREEIFLEELGGTVPLNTAKMSPHQYEQYAAPFGEPCLLVTDDGGDTWRLAVTADFMGTPAQVKQAAWHDLD
ncbi:BNR-4 repeat-containing protein [bacterium]|nr:BNR-4 repeat-containing protein [bacterium]